MITTTDDVALTREFLKAELEEEIRRLITVGATEGALIAVVAYLAGQFPEMTSAELSQAMQVATAAVERQAIRRHWWDLPICRAAGRRLKDYIARGGRH